LHFFFVDSYGTLLNYCVYLDARNIVDRVYSGFG